MDHFYDGQIRRYVTQFMRIFIGFQCKSSDGSLRHVPVTYGDMNRQVASIIKENSENKIPSVPKIACYITGLELDKTRLSDPTFVSKLNIRERDWQNNDGEITYNNSQGRGYTIERLMPTPFNLTMKTDIWTNNVEQKLQLFEQIMVLFNPSLAIQTTDNYVDWTSLSVVELQNIIFSSRSVPQGVDTDIDVMSLEFKMPTYITPPAKVKKLGIVRNVVMNVFSDTGDALALDDLIYNQSLGEDGSDLKFKKTTNNYSVLLLKSDNGQDHDYNLTLSNPRQAANNLGLEFSKNTASNLNWNEILELYSKNTPGISKIYFLQPSGNEIEGTFVVNVTDPTILLVTIESKPSNTIINSTAFPNGKTVIDAIIDPYKFNPIEVFGQAENIPVGTRYLMLDDVNNSTSTGGFTNTISNDGVTLELYDGPDAWKNLDGSDPLIVANSIIEWTGTKWENLLLSWTISKLPRSSTIVYKQGQIIIHTDIAYRATEDITSSGNIVTPDENDKFEKLDVIYVTNLKTGIQYRLIDGQWLKSFEGDYRSGYWRFNMDPL
jgi:hypothetical protein